MSSRARFAATSDRLFMPLSKAKPIHRPSHYGGFGGGSVLEVVAQHRGDTWRAVYTVRYPEAIYVLHAF